MEISTLWNCELFITNPVYRIEPIIGREEETTNHRTASTLLAFFEQNTSPLLPKPNLPYWPGFLKKQNSRISIYKTLSSDTSLTILFSTWKRETNRPWSKFIQSAFSFGSKIVNGFHSERGLNWTVGGSPKQLQNKFAPSFCGSAGLSSAFSLYAYRLRIKLGGRRSVKNYPREDFAETRNRYILIC